MSSYYRTIVYSLTSARAHVKGMFTPEREPHPAVAEIRYLIRPVVFEPNEAFTDSECVRISVVEEKNMAGIHLSVQNRYSFSSLDHLHWTWTLTSNRSTDPIRRGTFQLNDPAGDKEIYIDLESVVTRVVLLEKSRPSQGNSFFLNLQGALKEDTSWARAGHVLVNQQIPIKFVFTKPIPRKPEGPAPPTPPVSWRLGDGKVIIESSEKGVKMKLLEIDPKTGGIDSLFTPSGENLLAGPLLPNFTRAATDNDKGGLEQPLEFLFPGIDFQYLFGVFHNLDEFSYWTRWKLIGLDASAPPVVECFDLRIRHDTAQTQVHARASCRVRSPVHDTTLFNIQIDYNIWGNGKVRAQYGVKPTPSVHRLNTSLPRVGVQMIVVSWIDLVIYGSFEELRASFIHHPSSLSFLHVDG